MKLVRRIIGLTVALAVLMILAVPLAAGKDGYTYTVRISAGQQGTIANAGSNNGRIADDGNVLICEGLPHGQQIRFNNSMVSLNEGSKYYVKGIRESGKGTDEVSETGSSGRDPAFSVSRDQDYVVVYGVLTNPVQYTVNYVDDASGRELAPSESFYGNVGDHPVVAYLYIDGYQPRAYNLEKTLLEDPAENVFTFRYSPLPENNIYIEQTVTVESEPTPGPGTESSGGETPEGGDDTGSGASSQPTEDIPDNEVPATEPEPPLQSWNLDDGEVPLAGYDGNGTDSDNGNGGILGPEGAMFWNRIPLAAKIAGGVVMLSGFSIAVWLLIFRRRRKGDQ